MSLEILAIPAVILVTITSIGILIVLSWRWALLLLSIQYVGVFVLASLSWPFQMVLAKVIAGWMAATLLWMAQVSLIGSSGAENEEVSYSSEQKRRPHYSGRIFQLFSAGIVGLVVLSVTPAVRQWLPQLSEAQILGALILIGIGLLQLGLTSDPLWVILGLLTVLSGFEIIYAGVEISALVQGLLSGVTLGLGLIGAYMILSPTMGAVE